MIRRYLKLMLVGAFQPAQAGTFAFGKGQSSNACEGPVVCGRPRSFINFSWNFRLSEPTYFCPRSASVHTVLGVQNQCASIKYKMVSR